MDKKFFFLLINISLLFGCGSSSQNTDKEETVKQAEQKASIIEFKQHFFDTPDIMSVAFSANGETMFSFVSGGNNKKDRLLTHNFNLDEKQFIQGHSLEIPGLTWDGHGPIAQHPNEDYIYLFYKKDLFGQFNDSEPTIITLKKDVETGQLIEIQRFKSNSYSNLFEISLDGKHLYSVSFSLGTIETYDINPSDGTLSLSNTLEISDILQLSISDDGSFAIGRTHESLKLFSRNEISGILTETTTLDISSFIGARFDDVKSFTLSGTKLVVLTQAWKNLESEGLSAPSHAIIAILDVNDVITLDDQVVLPISSDYIISHRLNSIAVKSDNEILISLRPSYSEYTKIFQLNRSEMGRFETVVYEALGSVNCEAELSYQSYSDSFFTWCPDLPSYHAARSFTISDGEIKEQNVQFDSDEVNGFKGILDIEINQESQAILAVSGDLDKTLTQLTFDMDSGRYKAISKYSYDDPLYKNYIKPYNFIESLKHDDHIYVGHENALEYITDTSNGFDNRQFFSFNREADDTILGSNFLFNNDETRLYSTKIVREEGEVYLGIETFLLDVNTGEPTSLSLSKVDYYEEGVRGSILAKDSAGDIFVLNKSNGSILRLNEKDNNEFNLVSYIQYDSEEAEIGLTETTSIALSNDGRFAYVTADEINSHFGSIPRNTTGVMVFDISKSDFKLIQKIDSDSQYSEGGHIQGGYYKAQLSDDGKYLFAINRKVHTFYETQVDNNLGIDVFEVDPVSGMLTNLEKIDTESCGLGISDFSIFNSMLVCSNERYGSISIANIKNSDDIGNNF